MSNLPGLPLSPSLLSPSLPGLVVGPAHLWPHLSLGPSLLREGWGQARELSSATLPLGVIHVYLPSDSIISILRFWFYPPHYFPTLHTASYIWASPFCFASMHHVQSLMSLCSCSSVCLECPLTPSSSYPDHSQILYNPVSDCFTPRQPPDIS